MPKLTRAVVPVLAVAAITFLAGCGDAPAGAGQTTAAAGGDTPAPEPAATAADARRSEPAGPAAADTGDGGIARVSLDRRVHDFGVVFDAEPVQTSFELTNTGTGRLRISEVKAGCGCTIPELEKTALRPGESTAIRVTFDPSRRSGRQTKEVFIASNAQPGVAKVTITADVKPVVRPETHLMRLGTLELGRRQFRPLRIYHDDPEAEIREIKVSQPYLAAELAKRSHPNAAAGMPGRNAPQEAYISTIVITVGRDAPWGVLQDAELTFVAEGRPVTGAEPLTASYFVMISGEIYGELEVEPAVIYSRGGVAPGESFRAEATLSRAGGVPFTVTEARFAEPGVPGAEVGFERISPAAWRISVEGTAALESGTKYKDVIVLTDVEGEERIRIPFNLRVRKQER